MTLVDVPTSSSSRVLLVVVGVCCLLLTVRPPPQTPRDPALARLARVAAQLAHALPERTVARRLRARLRRTRWIALAHGASPAACAVDKGRSIALCLRDARGALYADDVLHAVLVHELAHVASVGTGHGAEHADLVDALAVTARSLGYAVADDVGNAYCR